MLLANGGHGRMINMKSQHVLITLKDGHGVSKEVPITQLIASKKVLPGRELIWNYEATCT